MGRLYRPHIPLGVRCIVALRQLNGAPTVNFYGVRSDEIWLKNNRRAVGKGLRGLLDQLAKKFGCDVSDLRLDHDPPLGARPKERRGLSKKTYYVPDANDPDHLVYRPHGPEFAGSHLIKTNVRGEHGQHPDRVLIKRQKRRERAEELGRQKPKAKMRAPKRKLRGAGFPKAKRLWPKQKFGSRRKP